MPLYEFRNTETKEIESYMMSHSSIEKFLEEHPELERIFSSPSMVSQVGSNAKKAGDGWNDLLTRIKNNSDSQTTIKTK